MPAITVYDHIRKNNIKTIGLILLFPTVLCVLIAIACWLAVLGVDDIDFTARGTDLWLDRFGHSVITQGTASFYAAGGYFINVMKPLFIIALGWMIISLFIGDKMMLNFANARPLTKKDNPKVYRAVENVAIAAGLPVPKVHIIRDNSLNAFATGYRPKTASIALTSGLVQKLSPLELEGVIAHEMAHIGNRDIRLNVLIITGLGIFVFLADLIRIFLRSRGRSSKENNQLAFLLMLVMFALMIFNCLFVPLIQMAISRTREYSADATAAKITHNPAALADALKKISSDARVEVLDAQKSMATACIANPHKVSMDGLTATHPPIGKRIYVLNQMARRIAI